MAPIPAVLARKTDARGVQTTCVGIDLAAVGPAPASHVVGIEGEVLDLDAVGGFDFCLTVGGETFEFIEGFRHVVVADGAEPRVVFTRRPESDLPVDTHSDCSNAGSQDGMGARPAGRFKPRGGATSSGAAS